MSSKFSDRRETTYACCRSAWNATASSGRRPPRQGAPDAGPIMALEQALSIHTLEIERLKLQLAKLRRTQFGHKSEKTDRKIEQIETSLEDLIAKDGEAEERQSVPAVARQKSVRQQLPAYLPREGRMLEPEEPACPVCGGNLRPRGEDVFEQLKIVDGTLKVIRLMCSARRPAPATTASSRPRHPAERSSAASLVRDCPRILRSREGRER